MGKGKIILVDGSSSAGKTSLAKELLAVLPEEYLYLSSDEFYERMMEDVMNLGLTSLKDKENINLLKGRELLSSGIMDLFYHIVKTISELGINVVLDHGINKKNLKKSIIFFDNYPVTFVGLTCPLHELERRERERGDRYMGTARRQNKINNFAKKHDIEVDTYISNIGECVEEIVEFLKNTNQQVSAFKKLRDELNAL
ncbi:MAG: AAA family ATPase [Halanaerobiales bacterium]|nr:AAA family ATPase [Halanaerobiales bacterium]